MEICHDHWKMMRDAIEAKGLWGLVAKSGEAAVENQVRQLEEAALTGNVSDKTTRDTFDPLMSMHWHFTNAALRNGGLYLMTSYHDEHGVEHEYCPICEFVKHSKGFDAESAIGEVTDQMREYCIEQKLIAPAQ